MLLDSLTEINELEWVDRRTGCTGQDSNPKQLWRQIVSEKYERCQIIMGQWIKF